MRKKLPILLMSIRRWFMKKGRPVAIICMLLVVSLSLVACNSKEIDKEESNLKVDDTADKYNQESMDLKDLDVPLEESTEESEKVTNEKKEYEKSSEWDTVQPKDRAFQVDDILLMPGGSLDDVIAKVETSECSYEYTYNPDKLVEKKDWVKIEVSLNGELRFTVIAYNLYSDTCSAKYCPVVKIKLEESAFPDCRFIDGRSYADILNMSYEDAKSVSALEGLKMFEKSTDSDNIEILYQDTFSEKLEWQYISGTEWSGYLISSTMGYKFLVDTNTAKVTDFYLDGQDMVSIDYRVDKDQSINALSEIDDESLMKFEKLVEEEIVNWYIKGFQQIENAEYLGEKYLLEDLVDMNTPKGRSLAFLYKATTEKGDEKYVVGYIVNPVRDGRGEFTRAEVNGNLKTELFDNHEEAMETLNKMGIIE